MSDMPAVSAQSPLQPGARVSPVGSCRPIEAQEPTMPTPAAMMNGSLITSHPSAGPLPPPMSVGDGGSLSAARGGQCSAPPPQKGRIIPPPSKGSASGGPVPGGPC